MTYPDYQTPENQSFRLAKRFPGLFLYSKIILVLLAASRRCSRNIYTINDKIAGSARILRTLERIGGNVFVDNMSAFIDLKGPCVFAANHMSALEAFLLPYFIMPHRKVTFANC